MEFNAYDVLFKCILPACYSWNNLLDNTKYTGMMWFFGFHKWFSTMPTFHCLYYRQANDLEKNPGPTIFDVIDPTRTICADYSQGNEALFGENAGKQCVAMSLLLFIIILKISICGLLPLWIMFLPLKQSVYFCEMFCPDKWLFVSCIVSIYK